MPGCGPGKSGRTSEPPSSAKQGAAQAPQEPVREVSGAGRWFPKPAGELRAAVQRFLDQAKTRVPDKTVLALVSPHAGYPYSGPVAGEAYATVRGAAYDTVFVIGSPHRFPLDGISVLAKGSIRTPLGILQIDEAAAAAMMGHESGRIKAVEKAFDGEHSVENQFPFLQLSLSPGFKLVPLLIRARDPDDCAILGKAIAAAAAGKKALVVASTDLSHFPTHDGARSCDPEIMAAARSLDAGALLAKDAEVMARGVAGLDCTMCGLDAVAAALIAARALGAVEAKVLDVRDSHDTAGADPERVVGYGALAAWKDKEGTMNPESKKTLLGIARESAQAHLERRRASLPAKESLPAELRAKSGAFVTLRNPRKTETLRGCIGNYNLGGSMELWEVVAEMAIAATQDSRFYYDPVTFEEMRDSVRVEISVLSPFKRMKDPGAIRLGVHGVSLVWKGSRQSVYLPQVATETGWDLETFLSQLCEKGRLPGDAWKDAENMEFDIFTAEVVSE